MVQKNGPGKVCSPIGERGTGRKEKRVDQADVWTGSSRAISVASALRTACQRSQSNCNPNQKSADMPRTRANRNAVSGVTPRFPRTISFSRGNDILKRTANLGLTEPEGSYKLLKQHLGLVCRWSLTRQPTRNQLPRPCPPSYSVSTLSDSL